MTKQDLYTDFNYHSTQKFQRAISERLRGGSIVRTCQSGRKNFSNTTENNSIATDRSNGKNRLDLDRGNVTGPYRRSKRISVARHVRLRIRKGERRVRPGGAAQRRCIDDEPRACTRTMHFVQYTCYDAAGYIDS